MGRLTEDAPEFAPQEKSAVKPKYYKHEKWWLLMDKITGSFRFVGV